MCKRTAIKTVRALAHAIIHDSIILARRYDRRAGYETERKNAARAAEAFKVART